MDASDIKLVEVTYVELEEVEKPIMIYKYRSWNKGNSHSDNVLLKNQLYLAEPSSFVDEYDCKIPIRYDLLTNEETLLWGEPIVRRAHPRWNDKAIKAEVIRLAKNLPFNDEAKMKIHAEQEWIEYNEMAGVLSMCTNSLNPQMWEMYGDNNEGICYGYYSDQLIRSCRFRAGGPVIYEDEIPIIYPLEDPLLKATIRVYSKLKKWEFEEEYRLRDFNIEHKVKANRIRTYSDNVLREVTLGEKFDIKQLPIIIEALQKKGSHAILYQCSLTDGKLSRIQIAY